MEPFVKYPGGKSKETSLVDKYMPKNVERYFEPFVGGGAIYFHLNINANNINDKSIDLMDLYGMIKNKNSEFKNYLYAINTLWKCIEEKVDPIIFDPLNLDFNLYTKYYKQSLSKKRKKLSKFENDGLTISEEDKIKTELTARKTAIYMLFRDIYNNTKYKSFERVATYYFLREYCYSSMFRFSKNGNFNVPYGGRSYDKKYMDDKLKYIFSSEMENKLENTNLFNLDFEEFFRNFEFLDNDFIFLDPPYDSDFSTYDNNSFDKNEQIRLRDSLTNIRAKWMLIIKKTDFITSLYQKFHIFEYDMNYMVSFKNRNDRKVEHLLITNYEIEEGLK